MNKQTFVIVTILAVVMAICAAGAMPVRSAARCPDDDGVDIGESYYGSAPDIGAHEYERQGVICTIT